ncbi:nitrogenase-stabilizing/protective protein NifW [Cylindrospermopsis curvispora]|uniref:Nitrogenase-stabilizing/protective protein NifW n=1 Tax=Cylindrospermopsis curvispora GIHE-G1 TaxID=2666332 RepID=A0A7H0EWH3_9CYAN|nr:nitrogenase-stabilizing/protective protein NifW [Cylindrospermopsis curvispora]QNP28139.1 nitrogenase-stabilizing/protective protein NifW [Cylindrospermopsis curvispora GIHE-G1]
MNRTMEEFKKIVDAEAYFQFFNLGYDQHFVNVNRLHILKKFSQFMYEIDQEYPNLSDLEKLEKYSTALQQAYRVFMESTPHEQKLFKVFNDKPKNVVTLTDIISD